MRKKKSQDNFKQIPLTCFVCGDIARGINFNLTTCMSCKAFFRRNAFKKSLPSECQFGSICQISKKTRGFCSPCRLKKCFSLGMNPDRIRKIPLTYQKCKKSHDFGKENSGDPTSNSTKTSEFKDPNRSILTSDQWKILSNVIRNFDEQNLAEKTKSTLHHLSSLPPKLRLKESDNSSIISQFFTSIQSLVEHSTYVHGLSNDACRALTKHNLTSAGLFNVIFICHELNLYGNEIFSNACNLYFGSDFMVNCIENFHQCDLNGNIVKLMLFIVTFSSNCSIVSIDQDEDISIMTSSKDVMLIQDIYVTILWKYMIYLYGDQSAVIRFSSLVKKMLEIIHMLESIQIHERHHQMIHKIVHQTKRAVTH